MENSRVVLSENTQNGVLDGLDTLLTHVENETSFSELLDKRFWTEKWNALLQVITYGTLSSRAYYKLSKIKPQKYIDFFMEIDFTSFEEKIWIVLI